MVVASPTWLEGRTTVTERRARAGRRLGMRAAAALTAACVLAGCSNPDNTTRLEGAGVGAGVGALIGGLIGGDSGAVIGAGIGAGLGLIGAEVVNTKRRVYANNEDRLAQEQKIAESNLTAARDYNKELTAKIDTLDKQESALLQAQAQGQAVTARLASTRETISKQVDASHKQLATTDKALAESQRNLEEARAVATTAEGPAVATLSAEIVQLEQERDALRVKIGRLEAAGRRL